MVEDLRRERGCLVHAEPCQQGVGKCQGKCQRRCRAVGSACNHHLLYGRRLFVDKLQEGTVTSEAPYQHSQVRMPPVPAAMRDTQFHVSPCGLIGPPFFHITLCATRPTRFQLTSLLYLPFLPWLHDQATRPRASHHGAWPCIGSDYSPSRNCIPSSFADALQQ